MYLKDIYIYLIYNGKSHQILFLPVHFLRGVVLFKRAHKDQEVLEV